MRIAVILESWDIVFGRIRTLLAGAETTVVDVLVAVVLIGIGWLLAMLIGRAALYVLRWVRFNDGIRSVMGEPTRREPAVVAAWVIHWTIMVLAIMLAGDVLGFELSVSVNDRLRDLLPRLMAATIVLVVGFAVAILLGAVARRLFASGGFRGSRLRGQIVTAVLTGFAVLLSLEQLGLAAQFVLAIGLAAVAAIGLGIALAFGLGCRDLARDFVVEYLRSLDDERAARGGPGSPADL